MADQAKPADMPMADDDKSVDPARVVGGDTLTAASASSSGEESPLSGIKLSLGPGPIRLPPPEGQRREAPTEDAATSSITESPVDVSPPPSLAGDASTAKSEVLNKAGLAFDPLRHAAVPPGNTISDDPQTIEAVDPNPAEPPRAAEALIAGPSPAATEDGQSDAASTVDGEEPSDPGMSDYAHGHSPDGSVISGMADDEERRGPRVEVVEDPAESDKCSSWTGRSLEYLKSNLPKWAASTATGLGSAAVWITAGTGDGLKWAASLAPESIQPTRTYPSRRGEVVVTKNFNTNTFRVEGSCDGLSDEQCKGLGPVLDSYLSTCHTSNGPVLYAM